MKFHSTMEVFADHLELARVGDVETDIRQNYAEDCVLLTTYGIFSGREGARQAANLLSKQLPDASFSYRTRLVHREIAFLEWEADSGRARVKDGADSFFIQNGLIQVMTIHYTLKPKEEEPGTLQRP